MPSLNQFFYIQLVRDGNDSSVNTTQKIIIKRYFDQQMINHVSIIYINIFDCTWVSLRLLTEIDRNDEAF